MATDRPGEQENKGPFLPIMAVVAVLAALYYAFIAAPMYVSEFRFSIHDQQAPTTTTLLAGLTGTPTGLADVVSVQDYVLSNQTMLELDKQFHLREAYSRFRPDLFNWLPPNASQEKLLDFYRRMIVVKLDRQAFIVEIDVRSFDRDTAAKLAKALLTKTEDFVDGSTLSIRTQSMQDAQTELNRAEAAAQVARDAVQKFRGASSAVDPAVAGAQVQSGAAAIEAQAFSVQAQLASAQTYGNPNSPQVQQLQASLNTLKAQIARLKSQQSASNLPHQVTTFETLEAQRTAAEARLELAKSAYEQARAQAQQREKYVVQIVSPNVPDKAIEPERIRDFLMVMVFAVTGYAIVGLAIAGIRDHQGV